MQEELVSLRERLSIAEQQAVESSTNFLRAQSEWNEKFSSIELDLKRSEEETQSAKHQNELLFSQMEIMNTEMRLLQNKLANPSLSQETTDQVSKKKFSIYFYIILLLSSFLSPYPVTNLFFFFLLFNFQKIFLI